MKKKRKSKDSNDFDKIEEIRIVKRAVSAFKRRKRGGGSKEGERKTEAFKMETVADRVMKMRIQSGGLDKNGSGMFTHTIFISLTFHFHSQQCSDFLSQVKAALNVRSYIILYALACKCKKNRRN